MISRMESRSENGQGRERLVGRGGGDEDGLAGLEGGVGVKAVGFGQESGAEAENAGDGGDGIAFLGAVDDALVGSERGRGNRLFWRVSGRFSGGGRGRGGGVVVAVAEEAPGEEQARRENEPRPERGGA